MVGFTVLKNLKHFGEKSQRICLSVSVSLDFSCLQSPEFSSDPTKNSNEESVLQLGCCVYTTRYTGLPVALPRLERQLEIESHEE